MTQQADATKEPADARPMPGPRGIASFTAARRLLSEPAPEATALAEHHGPVVRLGGGPLRIALIGGADEIAELLSMPVDRFRWDHRVNVLRFVVGGASMLVSDGESHRRRRGAVMHGFARRRLTSWIPLIVDQADRSANRIMEASRANEGTALDLTPFCRDFTISVITETMLGQSVARHADEVGRLFVRPQAYLESPAVRQIPHPIPFTRRAKVRADVQATHRIIDNEIAALRAGDETPRNDVLAEMVAGGVLDDDEIRDQVVTLIGAGYDTSAAALCWTLWRAASTPGLWQRLRTEAGAVLADGPSEQALAGLDLATRTVKETLRLDPPALGGVREAVVDVVVGGYRIPAGTIIVWSSYLSGRDASVWDDPLRFDPDRFLDLSPEQKAVADRAWAPFGGGARNCIGFALAQMELTLALARFAQRLDLTPAHDGVPTRRGMVVSRPDGGVRFRVGIRAEYPRPTVAQ